MIFLTCDLLRDERTLKEFAAVRSRLATAWEPDMTGGNLPAHIVQDQLSKDMAWVSDSQFR